MARRTIAHVPMAFRPLTGPLQFSGDWPGVFLRGDECGEYGHAIGVVRDAVKRQIEAGNCPENTDTELLRALASLQALSSLLKSCRLAPPQAAAMVEGRGRDEAVAKVAR
ncbi:hypothetical protein [Acidovorax sp. SDU_ACID1]|uniref:hypothetical protein n=1 Tax=Acidovorax sp. SDU_ACID1 TaxID=3136632 RepID=UPI00387350DC